MTLQRRVIFLLTLIMASVALLVGAISIALLYREALAQKQNDLLESVMVQASLIESVAQSSLADAPDHPPSTLEPVLRKVEFALLQRKVIAEGEERMIGQQEGKSIRFLIAANNRGLHHVANVPVGGPYAQGMQRALQSQQGVEELLDYQGKPALVAYAPLPSLGLGLVSKIELTALRAPFVRAAWFTAGLGLTIIGLGTVLFLRVSQRISKQVAQSQQRLQSVLDSIVTLIAVLDKNGVILETNQAPLEIYGLTPKAVIGKALSDLPLWAGHPDSHRLLLENLDQAAQGALVRFDAAASLPDGEAASIEVTLQPIRNHHGDVTQIVLTGVDVTARKQAKEALRQNQEKLEAAQRIAHIGNWVWEIESGKLEWTDEVYRIFGYAPQAFPATYAAFLERVHPEDRDRVTNGVERALNKTRPYIVDHRVVRPDGTLVVVHEQGEVTFDATGKACRMIGTVQDITLQKHYETELETLNERLEERVEVRTQELSEERNFNVALLETLGALVVILDSAGRIVRFNRACEAATGFSFAEVKGKPIWECLIPPEQIAEVRQVFDHLQTTQLPNHYENEWLTKNGERRLIAWSNSTLLQEGSPLVIGTGIDITARKHAEDARNLAKEEAIRANKAKSEFLSRMSHELRTPMNAILGFSQLLEADPYHPLPPEQQENVQEILKAGYHLLDLINEVLDLARIESGKTRVTLAPVALCTTIENACQIIATQAHERNIALRQQAAPGKEFSVLADEIRLRQVLVNLLSNAVKYNRPGGEITLGCEATAENMVRISVTDTGAGIPTDKIGQLFQPFERLGAEFSQTEGTGIGLALSKELVELMGGHIGVSSTPGEGSTFWLELPIATGTAAQPATTLPASPHLNSSKTARVLYVEDNPANLKLVDSILARTSGYQLLQARTAEIGLTLASMQRPDIILLDLNLPGMNGLEALRQLRADPATQFIPVIAVTAEAMPQEIERGLAAGFRAYLTKPFNVQELVNTLNQAIRDDKN